MTVDDLVPASNQIKDHERQLAEFSWKIEQMDMPFDSLCRPENVDITPMPVVRILQRALISERKALFELLGIKH